MSDRQSKLRERKAAAGLVRVEIWCHPQDAQHIRNHAKHLATMRDPKNPSYEAWRKFL